MVRLDFSIQLSYDVQPPGGDFIFNLQAARTPRQLLLHEDLRISQSVPSTEWVDPATQARWLRLRAMPGLLTLDYRATVDLAFYEADADSLPEVGPIELPGDVMPYLLPSRYCQSDRLFNLAATEFGHLPPGYRRAQAICDWVGERIRFESNTSTSATSALDTLVDRVGVCRDFAHLMIALCRAAGLPARIASGIDYGADPALGPQDFHAYVEVFLAGRWFMFDPSGTSIPMGFVRLATGRDAADIAFATLYGDVFAYQPVISIRAVPNGDGVLVEPRRVDWALSTDGV